MIDGLEFQLFSENHKDDPTLNKDIMYNLILVPAKDYIDYYSDKIKSQLF